MTTSVEERRWRELRARLGRFVGRRVRNQADAEDIVQDVFVRMQRGIGTLSSTDRLDAWAFRIARNAISDHYRGPDRREVPSDDIAEAVDSLAPDPGGEASNDARAEIAYCIAPLVHRLPDGYRDAIELTELEGLTQATSAKKLGLSISGTKSRVQRGRARLREMLLRCCEIETDRRGRVVAFEIRGEEGCMACGDERDESVSVAIGRPGDLPRSPGRPRGKQAPRPDGRPQPAARHVDDGLPS